MFGVPLLNSQSHLMRFNPVTNNWAYMGGNTNVNMNGVYPPSKGMEGVEYFPGGRDRCLLWGDSRGDIWLFGGYGLDSINPSVNRNTLNDLWRYRLSTHLWTWVIVLPHFGVG
jgi:hypothetical protein